MRKRAPAFLLAALLATAAISPAPAQSSLDQLRTDFGTLNRSGVTGEAALLGTLYDLKQDPSGRGTGIDPGRYIEVLTEFLRADWDERVLNRFYRASRPIYATHLFIPTIDAGEAPRAFGVEKAVQPSRWVIHYKADVLPPSDGTYRFVGGSDDYIAVRVDGRLVLSTGRPDCNVSTQGLWEKDADAGRNFNGFEIAYGNWIEFRRSRPASIDILVGERPGGQFDAYLLVQRQGDAYADDGRGNPVLPVFRVADARLSTRRTGRTPTVFADGPLWLAVQ